MVFLQQEWSKTIGDRQWADSKIPNPSPLINPSNLYFYSELKSQVLQAYRLHLSTEIGKSVDFLSQSGKLIPK